MTNQNSPVKGFRPIGTKPDTPKREAKPPAKGTIKCANCNFVMVDHAQFCPACGKSVSPAIEVAAAKSNICPACGAGNETGSMFCENCGAKISQKISRNEIPSNLAEPSGSNISKTHSSPRIDYQTSPSPAALPTSDPISTSANASNRKLVMPTVPKGAFGSYVKKGNFGPLSIGVLIIIICVLIFGGLALSTVSQGLHSDFLGAVGIMMMVLGFALHAISGFVGLVRLFAKGWTLEILGCMLIGAGSPILYPVLFGFLFYIFGETLPKRR